MTKPCVSSATLQKPAACCNEYTVDATALTGSANDQLPERTLRVLLDQSYRRDGQHSGEIVSAVLKAAKVLPCGSHNRFDLNRLNALMRTIGPRVRFKQERRQPTTFATTDIEFLQDRHWSRDFEVVETREVLRAAATHLEHLGVQKVKSLAVILHLLGWPIEDIAKSQSVNAGAVRKRITRARPLVIMELRRQFAQEVIS